MKKIIILLILLVAALSIFIFWLTFPGRNAEQEVVEQESDTAFLVEIVAQNLYVPWSIVFLPNGDLLATERNGTIKLMGDNKTEVSIAGVVERGEGGLLGIALHPDFESNKYLYLYFTSEKDGRTINKVVRYTFEENQLLEDLVIVDDIPGGANHNGGRISFGPDGMFYVTTGDAGDEDLAQDTGSLAGKILRVNDDGSIPSDNPFGNAVYSYGHRNPQGLAWDSRGNLWETEHGRSGVLSGFDEINRIERGGNYGWPLIQGDETAEGMIAPSIHSGASTTWAPSGIVFYDNALHFTGLRGRALYKAPFDSEGNLDEVASVLEGYGRLRGISEGKDGNLYVTTSNRDGRGTPDANDDRILKLSN